MCQAFHHILRSSKTRFTQGPLFCTLVRQEAIFAVCKRCANEGFACMCQEIVHYDTSAMKRVCSHEYRTKFYITRCENADFRTRSVPKSAFTHLEWYKQYFRIINHWLDSYFCHTVNCHFWTEIRRHRPQKSANIQFELTQSALNISST